MTTAVLMQALGLVFDPYVLLVIFCSALFGLFVGCIPGLTATMATALLVLSLAHGRIALAHLALNRRGNTAAGVEAFVLETLDLLFRQ